MPGFELFRPVGHSCRHVRKGSRRGSDHLWRPPNGAQAMHMCCGGPMGFNGGLQGCTRLVACASRTVQGWPGDPASGPVTPGAGCPTPMQQARSGVLWGPNVHHWVRTRLVACALLDHPRVAGSPVVTTGPVTGPVGVPHPPPSRHGMLLWHIPNEWATRSTYKVGCMCHLDHPRVLGSPTGPVTPAGWVVHACMHATHMHSK
jgi:hypothetical protein